MYPRDDKIAIALLRYIFEHGGDDYEVRARSTYKPVADHFGLSAEERTRTRDEEYGSGRDEPAWNNRVQWARRTLKKRGLLAPSRHGYWRLSEKALKRLRSAGEIDL